MLQGDLLRSGPRRGRLAEASLMLLHAVKFFRAGTFRLFNLHPTGEFSCSPRPEFFVLYNGVDPYPDEKYINLSDSFEKLENLGLLEKDYPALEMTVRVININEGRNEALAARCKKLAEYSAFIAKVRLFEKELGNLKEALKKAVIYCQKHDILREFLELHATEVLSMLMTEWNWDDALAVRYEEGKEDGLEEGLEKGLEEGMEKGLEAAKINIARNLLAKGSTFEFVHEITGLDMETIENL